MEKYTTMSKAKGLTEKKIYLYKTTYCVTMFIMIYKDFYYGISNSGQNPPHHIQPKYPTGGDLVSKLW